MVAGTRVSIQAFSGETEVGEHLSFLRPVAMSAIESIASRMR